MAEGSEGHCHPCVASECLPWWRGPFKEWSCSHTHELGLKMADHEIHYYKPTQDWAVQLQIMCTWE